MTDPNNDSVMVSNNSDPKSGPKYSKVLRRLEKLTKKDGRAMKNSVQAYMDSCEEYQKFVSRVDAWYGKNEKKYLRYMSLYAKEYLTETEFKLGLRDLRTPFNDLEIHILYQMLDPQLSGFVEYTKLYEAIWLALAKKYISVEELKVMDLDQPDRWVMMTFKIPSCEAFDLPTTFEYLVDLNYTGAMLRQIIQSHVTCLPTRNIVIFTDASRYAETVVKCTQRLSDFNYQGGPKCAPQEAVIFYEISMGRIDCPILRYMRDLERPRLMHEDSVKMDNAGSANQPKNVPSNTS